MSRPWTAEEDRKLQWLMSVGAETAQIARFFGRSQQAVCMRARSIRTGGSQKEPTRRCHDCGRSYHRLQMPAVLGTPPEQRRILTHGRGIGHGYGGVWACAVRVEAV